MGYFITFLYYFWSQRTIATPIYFATSFTPVILDSSIICPHGKICLWIMRLKLIQTSKPIYMGKTVLITSLFTYLRHSCNRLLIASQLCKLSPIPFAWANVCWKLTRCSAEKSMPSGAKVCGFKFRYCQFDKLTLKTISSVSSPEKNVRNNDTAHHKTVVKYEMISSLETGQHIVWKTKKCSTTDCYYG